MAWHPAKGSPLHALPAAGAENFEPDIDVIDRAADRQTLFLRNYASGAHASAAQQLLNEVAAARFACSNQRERRLTTRNFASE